MIYDSMDASRIVGYFKGKSILITGSTGFLGKVVVEKILRVQPDANKIYLLVRGMDASSAQERVQEESGTYLRNGPGVWEVVRLARRHFGRP